MDKSSRTVAATRLKRKLRHHQVEVEGDNAFQRKARLLQALWREEQGLPMGVHRGRPLGSRLAMPAAKDALLNYLTEPIRGVVRREVLDPARSRGKLYGKPRIFNDLLSSQPLCFNLFGELQRDLELATAVFHDLTEGRVREVTAIEFEHSPGRADPRYTGDRSAFDAFVEFRGKTGEPGFIGIEVKYHEALRDKPAPHGERYNEVADAMGCFKPESEGQLKQKPLQQIWRGHLLAGALLLDHVGFSDGFFAFVYPRENYRCASAVEAYQEYLRDTGSFKAWMLEHVVMAIRRAGAGPWVDEFEGRYLNFDELNTEG